MRRLPLLASAAALIHLPAVADETRGDPADRARWGVGLAVLTDIKPYRDHDNQTRIWPLLTFENRWVRVFGPSILVKLGRSGPLSYGLGATYGGDGYDAKDSAFLVGMADRKSSIWLGAQVNHRSRRASLSAEWSGDASGHSKGQRFKATVERRYGFGPLGVTPRLSATWHDRQFINYYYGVQAAEALSHRAAYAPGSAVNLEAGVRLGYRLAPRHQLYGDLSITALGSAIKNSPLVDRSTIPAVRAGYIYQF